MLHTPDRYYGISAPPWFGICIAHARKTFSVMNHGISILFRAIPLFMGAFCFAFGAYVFASGNDVARLTAGPRGILPRRDMRRALLHCRDHNPSDNRHLQRSREVLLPYSRLLVRTNHADLRNTDSRIRHAGRIRHRTCGLRTRIHHRLRFDRRDVVHAVLADSQELRRRDVRPSIQPDSRAGRLRH